MFLYIIYMSLQNINRKLEIKNVGPIKAVEFDINKVNLFIGPQGSGKSTIAKIISFCFWLEKNSILHQSIDHIDGDFFKENLLVFHKLDNYISKDSLIKYSGNVISFEYKRNEVVFVKKESLFDDAVVSKIAYVPAERVIASIPEIQSVSFPNHCLRNFLFEWFSVRNKYTPKNKLDISNLGVSYYFDSDSKKDVLVLENNKEVILQESSSGMQAAVPLYILLDYFTKWIYSHAEDVSFNKKDLISSALVKRFFRSKDKKKPSFFDKLNFSDKDLKDMMPNLLDISMSLKGALGGNTFLDKFLELNEKLGVSHFSNIVIEEPELNLFPATQVSLVYDILKSIKHDRDNIVITTHSPYILYALNNCMQAYFADEKDSKTVKALMTELSFGKESFIDPKVVSVWELEKGKFRKYNNDNSNETIQDVNGMIRKNYFDTAMQNVMVDFSILNSIS